jgi:glycosyltransferase involved in cell wall biosynthesis
MMVRASIVIRTFNSGRTIRDVLEGVRSQVFDDYEVVIVDSGSTDETLSIVQEYPHTFVDYSKEKFTYGGSLNAGCAAAKGEYVVSLSSHCIPLHNQWLGRLVEVLDEDERLAGAYGQLFYDLMDYPIGGTVAIEDADLETLTKNDGIELIDLEKFKRQPNLGLGNPNSIIRRELWTKRPFSREVWLEDHDWAFHFLQRGYHTAQVRGAPVHYAIPYGIYKYTQKIMQNTLGMYKQFGYQGGALSVSTRVLYQRSLRWLKATLLGKTSLQRSRLAISIMLGRWIANKVISYRRFSSGQLDEGSGEVRILPVGSLTGEKREEPQKPYDLLAARERR